MLNHTLSLESILVSAIGLMILLLFAGSIALALFVSDHKNESSSESESEYGKK